MAGEFVAIDSIAIPFDVPADWMTSRLSTHCEFIRDGDWIESKDQGGNDYRLLQISNVGVGRFVETGNYRWITEDTFKRLNCTEILEGDVLVARMPDPTGRAWCANELPWRAVTAVDVAIVRTKPHELDPLFLSYFLNSPQCLALVHGLTTGTTRLRIRRADIERLCIPLPPLPEQRAIAHILGTLDDKIELNRRMSETLEAMARALFKSWFVDFDPVRAKAEGRDPGLPQPLVDLFPARLVDSELGEIPEGWEVGALGDVAGHPRRGVQPNSMEPDTPYIALEHMPKRCIALSDWGVADGLASNKFEFRKGEILFGKLRPYFHKVGVAPVDGVCSTDIVVVASKSADWFGLVLGHVSSMEFVEYTNAGSTGTKMPRTSWYDMARYQIVLPPQPVVRAFNDLVRPLLDRIIGSIHQSRTLAALRDALLPRLISGELRVKDAEKFIERAAS
jgi:type I restriction enzyme S subunit